MRFYILLFTLTISQLSFSQRMPMWVWSSSTVLGNQSEENILINQCLSTGITDLYLYSTRRLDNNNEKAIMRSFISQCTCNGIKVWGMDGWRGYFSDLCGRGEFIDNIEEVIAYNNQSAPEERFVGFHGDNEFHVWDDSWDCGPPNVFHYGKTDAELSTTPGSGAWKSTEVQDRQDLMIDFIDQSKEAADLCHANGLEYSISVMPWVSGNNWPHGATGWQTNALMANYGGSTKAVYKHLMDYIDEYVIMSYHTNIAGKVGDMCEDELAYADGLPSSSRPRVYSGIETHCDVGQYVSYCDTPGEDNKTHVKSEMNQHETILSSHASYSGIAMHDWVGWKLLPSVSSNTSTPPGNVCIGVGTKDSQFGNGLIISPNPFWSDITIDSESDILSIEFLDLTGKVHASYSNPSGEIKPSITPGHYLVRITDANHTWTQQIIKQ